MEGNFSIQTKNKKIYKLSKKAAVLSELLNGMKEIPEDLVIPLNNDISGIFNPLPYRLIISRSLYLRQTVFRFCRSIRSLRLPFQHKVSHHFIFWFIDMSSGYVAQVADDASQDVLRARISVPVIFHKLLQPHRSFAFETTDSSLFIMKITLPNI